MLQMKHIIPLQRSPQLSQERQEEHVTILCNIHYVHNISCNIYPAEIS